MINVLLISANYPDKYHFFGPWNKEANISISKLPDIASTVLAPRPYVLPFRWFPYHNMSHLPLTETGIEGIIHYPRFLYLLPKKLFYPFTGESYRYFVGKYAEKNIIRPDIIHSHHAFPDGYGIIPLKIDWNIPLIVDIHGETFFTEWLSDYRLKRRIHTVIENSEKIVCVSKNIYKLAEKCKIPPEKLTYIPLGINIEKYQTKKNWDIKRRLRTETDILILFVGQLIERKGVNYLLKAISLLSAKQREKCSFVIIGEGPEKNYLVELSKSLKITDSLIFSGQVSEKELLTWYGSADIFILPSLSEGRPVVISEAMASECAIIASNISGIPEQVLDGYNGFLINPKDEKEIKNKIEYLLENTELLEKMKKNSRRRVIEEGWTWDSYAEKVNKIYMSILNE